MNYIALTPSERRLIIDALDCQRLSIRSMRMQPDLAAFQEKEENDIVALIEKLKTLTPDTSV